MMNCIKCRYFLILLLGVSLISCEKQIVTKKPEKTFVSSNDCENSIKLVLDGNKQFTATITSDIPVYEGVSFSGYYLEGNDFIKLVGILGDAFTLKKQGVHYLPEGMSEMEAKNQGWKLMPSE